MKFLNLSNKIIEFSFYALFFLIPLVFWKDTSELYELNKMWLTFGLTVLILAAWATKSVILKKFYLQKTPLDIPIAVFLLSQIVSTVVSWDSYVSFWGYYSRFNGGLLSTICYISLYYAFVSNFDLKTKAVDVTKKILGISLVSGTIVALWGLPSHFGYDPTCLLFRGSLDVSCWTSDFQPKVRIFSTLGQPDWLGAYLAILTPLLLAFFLNAKRRLLATYYLLLATLFYLDLLFTKSRSALLGAWVGIAVFGGIYFWSELKGKFRSLDKKFIIHHLSFIILMFLLLASTLFIYHPSIGKLSPKTAEPGTFSTGGGGTDSGKIRLFVWQGALNAWIHNPVIGTGVETFAFAFYKYKPVGHNLTSEWNFLYNKAHNEYLNFLATTGLFGLLSYLSIISLFLWICIKYLVSGISYKQNTKYKIQNTALLAGYLSILVTNFFGFSVVIINLYLFLIPAFVFVLFGFIKPKNFLFYFGRKSEDVLGVSFLQKIYLILIAFIAIYLLLFLRNFWLADQAYALGGNLERTGDYANSYSALKEAVARIPFEPTYTDELAGNDAIFSATLLQNLPKNKKQQDEVITLAENLAKEAIALAQKDTTGHPNNVTFWKTKFKVYYYLSQIDPGYTKDALSALEAASKLSPLDPTIYYDLSIVYGGENEIDKSIESLKTAVKVKPNYEMAHYALGLFYREKATDKNGKVINPDLNQKAIEEMQYILKYLDPKSKEAQAALDSFLK